MEESEKKGKISEEESGKPPYVSGDDEEIDLYELGMVLVRR